LRIAEWDLTDESKRPKTVYFKITPKIEKRVLSIRKQTGFGERKIAKYVAIGHTAVHKILNQHKLTKPNKNRKKKDKIHSLAEGTS